MSKKETKDRITREKEMLPEMVKIYCPAYSGLNSPVLSSITT